MKFLGTLENRATVALPATHPLMSKHKEASICYYITLYDTTLGHKCDTVCLIYRFLI